MKQDTLFYLASPPLYHISDLQLPPKQILEEKLKRAISLAKENQAKGSLTALSDDPLYFVQNES